MKKINIYLLIILSLVSIQCRKETKKQVQKQLKTSIVKYAKGFDIVKKNDTKVLIIKRAFQSSDKQFEFILGDTTNMQNQELKVPIEKMVVTSTTHIPMLELIGAENTIIGFPHTKYISSEKTRKLIDGGKITEIGSEQNMNTELLLDIQPELVVGFALHPNNKVYANIKKAGIPVIFNGEWLEETPLGRAEWIKFFGALCNKEKEADSIFKSIEKNYIKAKEIASKIKNSPTVLSGSMFKDVWNVPAGESFIATFLKDANLNYIWKDTKGTGSLQLNFESVLDKAQNADLWIGAGIFGSKEQLTASNKNYTNFKAFKNDNVYGIGNRKGPTGGLVYFELAPVRPDLVLKDMIKIANPNVLPDYELTFFEHLSDNSLK